MARMQARYHWEFRTNSELAAEQTLQFAAGVMAARKTLWVVVDGA